MSEHLSAQWEQLKALEKGRGVQYLLNEAYKIFGNPVLAHDMEYKLIACTENIVTDDPIWNEFITTGTIDSKWLEFYKNEGFFDAAANTKKMTFLISDKLKYHRIYVKLFNRNGTQVGCVVLKACDKPFKEEDPELFEYFCDIFSEELCQDEYYQNYGQEYLNTLVAKLIMGEVKDREIYEAHVESIYMHCKDNLYLAVADISKSDPTYSRLLFFRDLSKLTQPAFRYAIFDNYIVIIISTDDIALNVKRDLKQLNALFKENDIYAGVSSCFDNLFELNKYYDEAVRTLKNGLKSNGSQRIFLFEETANTRS